MRRVLSKIIIPVVVIGVWMLTCFYWCNKETGFDYFQYWICCGFPFGLRRMSLWLIPKNFGIAGGVGIWAVNLILAGLIGGFVIIFHLVKIIAELINVFRYLASGGIIQPRR